MGSNGRATWDSSLIELCKVSLRIVPQVEITKT